jgi:hypothetical protein
MIPSVVSALATGLENDADPAPASARKLVLNQQLLIKLRGTATLTKQAVQNVQ